MSFLKAAALAATISVISSPAMAQVPSLPNAIGYMFSGWGAVIAICVVGYMIGRQQFPEDKGWAVAVAIGLMIFFVGMGGMDWWTYGEFQGLPWETFDGQRHTYAPGRGWQ